MSINSLNFKPIIFILMVFFCIKGYGQNQWQAFNDSTFSLNFQEFTKKVTQKESVELPLPDGGFVPFIFTTASILPTSLGDKFSIRCFTGICTLDHSTSATLTIYEEKVYASIKFNDKSVNIKPQRDNKIYISHWISKPVEAGHVCELEESLHLSENLLNLRLTTTSTEKIKNYTIAISTTGEYTAFHGGTKGDALAAIATTLNRVNSIYNADLGINLILHPNTDKLIFTSSSTDPYNNSSAGAILNVAQKLFDDSLGNTTYDLGHIFSTGAGGLADLKTVCTGNQASGVTGTTSPIGDFYDVDFVSHEIGHQFGADHTFNGTRSNCVGNVGDARYEIGSGSTIMAYAGLCSTDNLQSHSDPYFHIESIKQIKNFVNIGSGSTCGFYSNEENTPPEIISQTPNGFVIPIATPFVLDGNASDLDGDMLIYNWEQMDLGSSTTLNNPIGSSPIFRSFTPSSETKRYFPRLPNLLAGSSSKGEILPTYARDLNFSFNVRDQKGGVVNGMTKLAVSTQSGPFKVNSPKLGDSHQFGQKMEVTWDVANTHLSPVNCQEVMIILSYDNGLTFNDTLIKRTANDGQELIQIPAKASTNCRIMIKAYDNVFFAVNNGRFSIVEPLLDDFSTQVYLEKTTLCSTSDQIKVTIKAEGYKNFNDSIYCSLSSTSPYLISSKPEGVFYYQDSLELVLSLDPNLAENEVSTLDFQFTSGNLEQKYSAEIVLYKNQTPSLAQLLSPSDNSLATSLKPNLMWAGEEFSKFKVFLFKDNISFDSSLVLEVKEYSPKLLEKSTTYEWQVKTFNVCGVSFSDKSPFTTGGDTCISFSSDTLPLLLPNGTIDFYNNLFIASKGIISDLSVVNLSGEHEWVSDLKVNLINPSGRSYSLFSDVCEGFSGSNFNLNLIANQTLPYAPCPPNDGGDYQPIESFESIIGNSSQGIWTLHIKDIYPDLDQGKLTKWGLNVCIDLATYSGAPYLIHNTPSSFSIGSVETLESSNLLAWDDVSKTNHIIFELVGQTSNLVLTHKISEAEIKTGSSFSQEDLLAGNIGVRMNDSLPVSYIAFTLKNNRNEVSDTIYHYIEFNGIIIGLEEKNEVEVFTLSPNPVTQKFTIPNYNNKEVKLFNVLGQLIVEAKMNETLDVSYLEKGLYLVRLDNGQILKFEKN